MRAATQQFECHRASWLAKVRFAYLALYYLLTDTAVCFTVQEPTLSCSCGDGDLSTRFNMAEVKCLEVNCEETSCSLAFV